MKLPKWIGMLALVLALGCGPTDSPQAESNDPSPAATELTSGNAPSKPDPVEQASDKPVDVREVGPPDPPKDDSLEKLQAAENPVDSPLKDIPVPVETPEPEYVEKQTIDIPDNWKRITKVNETEIWLDSKSKQVMCAGVVCVQQGALEMFICPMGTKEHESVLAVNAKSYEIHTAFLALGFVPGKPVQWDPEYVPATGPFVDIDVMWKDPESDNIITKKGKEMVRNFTTKKALEQDWVFGGSVLETDPDSGRTYYYGDGGELVCVSNFSTATMDLPIESSQSNDALTYEAFSENIPEPGTKVYVVFKPRVADQESPNSK